MSDTVGDAAPFCSERGTRPVVRICCERLSRVEISKALTVLSRDEIRRADLLVRSETRRRWIASRYFLRRVLADHVGMPPQVVRFRYGEFGKPELETSLDRTPPSFNLTHSEDLAVLALCTNHAVGVDVEHCGGSNVDARIIAEACLTEREKALLRDVPSHDRYRMLLWWWTCKEAYVKGIGKGLSEPLDGFEVAVTEEAVTTVTPLPDSARYVAPWTLTRLRIGSGYVGTLAVPGRLEPDIVYE